MNANLTANANKTFSYEPALRAFEDAHRIWFSTPVHSDAYPVAKANKDAAGKAYDAAYRAFRQAQGRDW